MKKKTKLSSSQADAIAFERFHLSKNSLLIPFLLAVFFCVCGAAGNIWLFCKSYFAAMSRLDQTPIATITFKYKAAERKFIDRSLWTRLKQNSPVYNGDTLHTGDLSEATVHFTDGNELSLSENTMAQVFLHEDESFGAELTEGSAVVDSSGAENGMTFTAGGASVEIQKGASVSAEISGDAAAGGAVALRLLEGSASVDGAALSSDDAVTVGAGGVKAMPLSVHSPKPDQKFLFHEGKIVPVKFSWKTARLAADEDLMIEVSDKKDFSEVAKRVYANGLNNVTLELESGAWYWRIVSVQKETTTVKNETRTASGRLQALYSPAPELITPANEYKYSYRTRNPSVRLIWSESPYATSYNLEISKRQDLKQPVVTQRSATTTSIISTLGAGTYYWRVTPFYTVNRTGLAAPSQIQTFTVEKRAELPVPQLLSPAKNGSLDITMEVGPCHFSWKSENEAAKYRIKIYKEGRSSNPLVQEVTEKNYLEVLPSQVGLGEGKWLWSVSQIDDEGNESKASEERMFYARKGQLFVRSIEPPEGYKVGNTFAADMKFTWKKNLPDDFESVLQVSKNSNFTELVYTAKAVGASASSISFPDGRYYWRIHSKNDMGMVIDTQPKMFEVLPQLDATRVLAPIGRALVHPETLYEFKWNAVDGADFYKLIIYKSGDGSIVHEDNVYDTETKIDMNSSIWGDRAYYRYELQARANAVEGKSSRRNGRLAEGVFQLVQIKPVALVRPARGAFVTGVDAVIKPLAIRWTSDDVPVKSQLIINRIEGRSRTLVLRYPNVNYETANPRIPMSFNLNLPETFVAGNYEVIIRAETSDGFDISNSDEKNAGRFRIGPVDPLPAIESLTVTPKVMDVDYLLNEANPRTFAFSWSQVKDATHYIVQVNDKRGRPLLPRIEVGSKNTNYIFDFMKVEDESIRKKLMNGNFQCAIQAVRKIDTTIDGTPQKKILQRSPVKTQTFTVDIGDPQKARGKKGAKNPYGL